MKIEKWSEWLDCGVWSNISWSSKSTPKESMQKPYIVGFDLDFNIFVWG